MFRLILTIASLLALTLPALAQAGPQLTLDETEFDFGFVPQNSNITHVFKLKSTGDDLLKILKVVTGCGCTKAPLAKNEIAPGEETELEIIFSTRRYRNTVHKSPRIETNAGMPHKTVYIEANVVDKPDSTYPIVIKPYKLDISQFGEKVRDEMTFTIQNRSENDLSIRFVDVPIGMFEIDIPAEVGAGQSVECKLRLKDNTITTSFEKSFTIQLDDPEKTRFTIPVKRQVRVPGGSLSSADKQ